MRGLTQPRSVPSHQSRSCFNSPLEWPQEAAERHLFRSGIRTTNFALVPILRLLRRRKGTWEFDEALASPVGATKASCCCGRRCLALERKNFLVRTWALLAGHPLPAPSHERQMPLTHRNGKTFLRTLFPNFSGTKSKFSTSRA